MHRLLPPDQQEGNSRAADNDASPFPTIMKVPENSRALNGKRYEPFYVSIGPYHRGSSKLCRANDKEKYVCELFHRQDHLQSSGAKEAQDTKAPLVVATNKLPENGESSGMKGVEVWKEALATKISKRPTTAANKLPEGSSNLPPSPRYYDYGDDSCPHTLEDFVEMLLLDGVYLVAAISGKTEYLLGSARGDIVRDTWYILENQIPFFVLQEIYARAGERNAGAPRKDFTEYAYALLGHTHQMCTIPKDPKPPETIYHLLHLLHTILKPHNELRAESEPDSEPDKTTYNSKAGRRRWRPATEYRKYANIEFVGRDLVDGSDVLSVLDVRIEGRNVVIPCLRVDGATWTILLNLMALEGQHRRLGTYVTAYCLFMSQIASTKEDVELLEAKGVIDRHLSTPERVADDFSRLCDAVVLDMSNSEANYLKPLWQDLEKRYTSRRQNILGWLRLNYFTCRNVSVLLGVFSAFILLGAGVISAVYQVLSYYIIAHQAATNML